MRIVSAHEGVIPISSSMSNAFIDFSTMDCSILALVSDVIVDGKPLVGYGFNSNGRYSAGEILRRRILPRLMDAPEGAILDEGGDLSPSRAWDTMMRNEKPGGHGERSVAVGVVDMALHDLAAKIAGVPLYRWISDHYGDGDPDDSVFVYAAGGYYAPGKSDGHLQDEMRRFLAAGYDVVKMKIGGAPLADDLRRIEAVLEVLDGDGSRLAVDVNGRFDLDTALEYAKALDPYGLFWYEEVGDPLDYRLNATLSEHYENPIATGENLFSLQDARNLVRYGGMRPDRDYIQVDPALSYGLVEYRRIQDMLAQHGWSSRRCIPHGGHQFSLHIAAALKLGGNESYPGEFQPTGGFADDAVVDGGRVALDDRPGIGFEGKANFLKVLRELHE
ncbi:mandelate racemase/muconate lactonizing enzyme family protein [Nocardioides sp. zg-1228]|uniref:mandelate racemase/muconate lactonizing enzyme family protein n=1 Tax=Nocardioides sp. zg-1228 TaxID=2763008 RepID=UPI00164354AE|nr:mandelate racemase/muconate lactonizing enzyme family protein [Nocardioides sp. zg-1228]MBC2932943.1 mandelate racemase/muconate lactonizing enzyme family protein [Nocardioides sp. zg-1228]QSF56854.1 mandelate racemase/muconate lactonizing enzyme family protein [Nocardioides sp. zg-1228]